jgi:hypothetical protein
LKKTAEPGCSESLGHGFLPDFIGTDNQSGFFPKNSLRPKSLARFSAADGGPYWTRTSDLFHVKETL